MQHGEIAKGTKFDMASRVETATFQILGHG